jgi:hypothetical protein
MNKAQVGRTLASAFSKHCLWEGMAILTFFSALVSGVAVFFAIISQFGIRPPREAAASYEFVASSIVCFLFFVALSRYTYSNNLIVEATIKENWMKLYKGTEWKTPAGEKGVVSAVNIDANSMEILFEDGRKHYFPQRYLTPVNSAGPEADFSLLKADGSVDWKFYGSRIGEATACTVMFWFLMAVLTWSVFHTDIPAWSFLPILATLFLAVFIPFGLLWSSAPFYRVGDFAFPALVSKTTWKALDGRVGVVRWAKRESSSDNHYTETILLAFSEGDEHWFRRSDLKPTAFEC